MKYIELYLNQRKEELEKDKERIIEEFKEKYKKCITTTDYQELIDDCACCYDYELTWDDMKLKEVERLREDLLGSDKE